MKNILNLSIILAKAKYLSIPLFFNKSKKLTFEDLKHKLLAKVSGWRSKLLSQAAKTTLIKVVANSILAYIMSIFLRPKGFCQDLNSILRKFWWGFPPNKSHNLTLLAWDNICKPKYLGGLGIRSLDTMNLSLLAKLGWNLSIKKPMLWVKALAGKYLNFGQNFLNVVSRPLDYWLWKGLLNCRSIVEKGAYLAISMGSNINVWSDPWIPNLESFKPCLNPNLMEQP